MMRLTRSKGEGGGPGRIASVRTTCLLRTSSAPFPCEGGLAAGLALDVEGGRQVHPVAGVRGNATQAAEHLAPSADGVPPR